MVGKHAEANHMFLSLFKVPERFEEFHGYRVPTMCQESC